MSARAIWKGNLSLSLMTFPVKAYKSTDEATKQTAMHEFHAACNCPVNRKSVCHKCATDVLPSDIVKGVTRDNKVIIVSDAEMESIRPESSGAILLDAMIPANAVDPIYVEQSYYLSADGPAATEAYATTVAALNATGRMGQGRFTIYGRERNVTIRPCGGTLLLQLMRTKNEVRDDADLPGYIAPGAVTPNPAILKLAEQLVNSLAAEFDPTEYEDSYAADWKALIESKASGTPLPVPVAAPKTNALDLMASLTASLAGAAKPVKKTVKADAKPLGPKSTKGKKAA